MQADRPRKHWCAAPRPARRHAGALLALALLASPLAHAGESLSSYFAKALVADPDYAGALATRDAEVEYRAIARAGLLPAITLNASQDTVQYSRSELGGQTSSTHDYTPTALSLRLVQPLYNRDRAAFVREGDVRAQRAEIVLADARKELALRLAQALWNYLLSADQLDLSMAQNDALRSAQVQAENLFKSGMATRTDVEETRARQQQAQAQVGAAMSNQEQSRREFAKVAGELPAPDLARLSTSPLLLLPEPADVNAWMRAARENNFKVQAQRAALDIARIAIERVEAAAYPTLSLVASRQQGRTPNYFTRAENTTQVGLQLSLSLFDGGGTAAQVRQAVAQAERARRELDSAVADAEIKASQSYWAITNGVGQIRALEQALVSAQTALQGMQIGQRVGLRTNTEVLNAQQQVFVVRRDLQKERYLYLFNRLLLQATIGALDQSEIMAVEKLVRD